MHSTQFSDSLPLTQVRPYFVCKYGLCIHSSPRTNSVLCTKTDLKQPVASAVPMSRCPLFIPLPPPAALSLLGMGDKMGKVAGPEQSDKCMYRQKRRKKRRRWLLARFSWQPPLGGSIDTAIRVTCGEAGGTYQRRKKKDN